MKIEQLAKSALTVCLIIILLGNLVGVILGKIDGVYGLMIGLLLFIIVDKMQKLSNRKETDHENRTA